MQYLTVWDLVLTPIYLLVLTYIAKRMRDKRYPVGNPLRKYYLPGLFVKFGGAIFIALIYQYYYGGGGDTFNYFKYGRIVNSSISDSFDLWLKLLLRLPVDADPKLYEYANQIEYYTDPSSYTVVQISALLGLIGFNTYLPIALLFAFISYTGIWAMYKTFVNLYPLMPKHLAIAFLFVPSVFVWGSSIFKDTICMFGLGWMTYCTFRIFLNKDFSIQNFIFLILSFLLIGVVKIYILLAFIPSLILWLLLTYSHNIKNFVMRIIVRLAVVVIVITGFSYFSTQFASQLNRYSLDRLVNTAESTRGWIVYSSGEEGSAYDIGTIDPSVIGIINKFPAAVSVTLFRPFLWEVNKPIMLLSSFEGIAFIILTLMAIYLNGFFKFFKLIFTNPTLIFFFTYSMIFAFAVGISTGNFGTLSRYKIPCMPFFAALLIILYFQKKVQSKTTIKNVPARKPVYHIA